MEPASTLAPVLAYACVFALAGLAVHHYRRIAALRARISDAARTDPLTGLLNRRALEELLDVELERATRAERPLSVIVGDLDSFAVVNEHHGHAAGDSAHCREERRWHRRARLRVGVAAVS